MIAGKVTGLNGREVAVLTPGGVGYRLAVSPRAAERATAGAEVQLPTCLVVRDDALELYGFADAAERRFFELAISVSGVGPRIALHLLELGSVAEIAAAIGRSDVAYLTQVSGIGTKTAERLVVELKNKIGESGAVGGGEIVSGGMLGEVVQALVAMGYGAPEARAAVKQLEPGNKPAEVLLREALRIIK